MSVWITRSEPGASRQALALRAAGYPCLVVPVLEIEPVIGPVPAGPFAVVVFLSEHAVTHGHMKVELGHARLLAVGARTADVLAAAGHAATRPARVDSEGLLALPELAEVAGLGILLVGGAGGRTLLDAELTARGARVARLVCYRRRGVAMVAVDPTEVTAIVAASADGLESMARHWFAAHGSADVPLLVPSGRVGARGVALGFRNVHDCQGADTASVLRGLAQIFRTGTP